MLKHLIILLLSFFFFLFSSLFSQNHWIKYNDPSTNTLPFLNSDPVLAPGLPGEWDGYRVWIPTVVFKDNGYHLWFCTSSGVPWDTAMIGYATSPDGISWTKYNDPTTTTPPYVNSDPIKLTSGPPGDWDHYGVWSPHVLWNDSDSLFHLWYFGWWDNLGNGYGSIGYATSPDGIHWTKYNDPTTVNPPFVNSDPVLNFGLPGEWDGRWIGYPYVLRVGDVFHMYYVGWSGLGQVVRIGHATSGDGIDWQEDPLNPVLNPWPGTWDFSDLRDPTVWYSSSDSIYHMWYSGGMLSLKNYQVGYATSQDGSIWIKDTLNNPVLTPGAAGSWDANSTSFCDVLVEHPDSALKMWYTGLRWNSLQDLKIGYATNPLCKINVMPESITHSVNSGITIQDSLLISNIGDPQARDLWFIIESPAVSWLSFSSPLSDTLAAGESTIVNYTINTTAIDTGAHSTRVKITSNYFFNSRLKIPVQLQVVSDIETKIVVSNQFSLWQNYPNPFNPRTTISWQLAVGSPVKLTVYNIQGQKVASLINQRQTAGSHSIEWDASEMASGVYLYRLEADGYVETRKMVLMK